MRCLLPIILFSLLLGAGCRGPATDQVDVAPGVGFRLCPPEAGPAFFAIQEMDFTLPGGGRETAVAAIENKGGTLSLVASDPLGETLFTVQVRGRLVAVDPRVPLPPRLDPKLLPALVQLALWPAPAVRAGLAPEERLEEDGPRRTLLSRGRVVWTVIRTGTAPPYRSLVLENPDLGMSVRVRTLEE